MKRNPSLSTREKLQVLYKMISFLKLQKMSTGRWGKHNEELFLSSADWHHFFLPFNQNKIWRKQEQEQEQEQEQQENENWSN